jgi:hypothetical protein
MFSIAISSSILYILLISSQAMLRARFFGSVELLFVMSKFYLFVYYIRMGAVLYKADFLYPHREPPTWAINDDVGPYHMQNNVKNSS